MSAGQIYAPFLHNVHTTNWFAMTNQMEDFLSKIIQKQIIHVHQSLLLVKLTAKFDTYQDIRTAVPAKPIFLNM